MSNKHIQQINQQINQPNDITEILQIHRSALIPHTISHDIQLTGPLSLFPADLFAVILNHLNYPIAFLNFSRTCKFFLIVCLECHGVHRSPFEGNSSNGWIVKFFRESLNSANRRIFFEEHVTFSSAEIAHPQKLSATVSRVSDSKEINFSELHSACLKWKSDPFFSGDTISRCTTSFQESLFAQNLKNPKVLKLEDVITSLDSMQCIVQLKLELLDLHLNLNEQDGGKLLSCLEASSFKRLHLKSTGTLLKYHMCFSEELQELVINFSDELKLHRWMSSMGNCRNLGYM